MIESKIWKPVGFVSVWIKLVGGIGGETILSLKKVEWRVVWPTFEIALVLAFLFDALDKSSEIK